jgi:hypothetical protein
MKIPCSERLRSGREKELFAGLLPGLAYKIEGFWLRLIYPTGTGISPPLGRWHFE